MAMCVPWVLLLFVAPPVVVAAYVQPKRSQGRHFIGCGAWQRDVESIGKQDRARGGGDDETKNSPKFTGSGSLFFDNGQDDYLWNTTFDNPIKSV